MKTRVKDYVMELLFSICGIIIATAFIISSSHLRVLMYLGVAMICGCLLSLINTIIGLRKFKRSDIFALSQVSRYLNMNKIPFHYLESSKTEEGEIIISAVQAEGVSHYRCINGKVILHQSALK